MVAVRNLTFQVMPGEVLGLLGPNGAGKSTTMNMLTAEITPDAGAVCIICISKVEFLHFFKAQTNVEYMSTFMSVAEYMSTFMSVALIFLDFIVEILFLSIETLPCKN